MSMSMVPTTTTSDMNMGMASATTSSMSMASTSSMTGSMDGMKMSMSMVFFIATDTPLWSSAWTPNTTGQYAGTCIFLIAFAATFRALIAIRIHFFKILATIEQRRNGSLEYPTTNSGMPSRPWRAREAMMLAVMDVILAGVSYLLMLAVMTMNVGYFLSVLAGVFLGSMTFGHWLTNVTLH